MSDRVIENTIRFVEERLGTEPTGHDHWHSLRVLGLSRHIQAIEGGSRRVTDLSSLLHDVGDRKVLGTENDDHSFAEAFMRSRRIGASTISSTMLVIENMSFSKSLDNQNAQKTIEQKIVEDADKLDALGAIGVARAFAFGASRGRPLYDPANIPEIPRHFASSSEYKAAAGSTLDHFEEKLFLLKDRMHTETGRAIAEERHKYMEQFFDKFLNEWYGRDF